MAKPIRERFTNAWNAFTGRETQNYSYNYGPVSIGRSDKVKLRYSSTKTILAPIYNRMAMDVAQCTFEHVRTNADGRYIADFKSGLYDCLTLSANTDQTGRVFIQDLVLSLFDEGVIAVVPVDCSVNPKNTESYDILTLRTGRITEWFPEYIKIDLYNEQTGKHQEIIRPKYKTAIIENPFYAVMNETNGAVRRYANKLALLDKIDERQGSDHLDIIIQLPYLVRSPRKKQEAEDRRKELERQLSNSDYGVAYTDGSEKIVQLNRPLENTLSERIDKLETTILNQLGISKEVFDGTATEEQLQTYYTRAIAPVAAAICDEFTRKFLSYTAISQGQRVWYHKDPFAFTPTSKIADMADRFTRNEILSPNEIREAIGYRPVEDVRADELRNRNISMSPDQMQGPIAGDGQQYPEQYDQGQYEEVPGEETEQYEQ